MTAYLYILSVTKDMPSMGRGKAVAHAAHAANLFTYEHMVKPLVDGKGVDSSVLEWHKSADGFGTTIALDIGTVEVMNAIVDEADKAGFMADTVRDPTYPYMVDAELVQLIRPEIHTLDPICLDSGMYVCHRNQTTAAYVFGDKDALSAILGKFNLLSNDTVPKGR